MKAMFSPCDFSFLQLEDNRALVYNIKFCPLVALHKRISFNYAIKEVLYTRKSMPHMSHSTCYTHRQYILTNYSLPFVEALLPTGYLVVTILLWAFVCKFT